MLHHCISLPHNFTYPAEQTQNETTQVLRTVKSATSEKMHSQGWESYIWNKSRVEMQRKHQHADSTARCRHAETDTHRRKQKRNITGE